MKTWWEETLHSSFQLRLRIDKLLHETKSEFQHLMVFENELFGRVLTLDGVIQTTERDEFIYHEMLSHTPILAHGDVRNVLIIGGGDGGMLRRVLMHPIIESVVVVEIDGSVIDLCKRYLPSICGDAFNDLRTEVIVNDGASYVAECNRRFDVIIVDSTDPLGPAEVLFEHKFYAGCKSCLAPRGVIVTQNGVPFFQGSELSTSVGLFRSMFIDVTCFLAPVPTYAGGFMAFGWASDDTSLRPVSVDTLTDRICNINLKTRYYTPEIHKAAFALPSYIEALTAPT
jgi:spermidine synthase